MKAAASLPLAVLAGALLPLSMAPFGLWPLGLVSVGLWFWLAMASHARGYLIGFCYGLGSYGLGVSWIYVSIHEHGNASPLLAGFLVTLFAAGMSLFPLSLGAAFQALKRLPWVVGDWIAAGGIFVLLLVALEWILTWFLTGFPWLMLGYGHLESPLAGFAPVGGVLLMSALVAAVAVALVLLIRNLSTRGARGLTVGLVLTAILPWLLGGAFKQVIWTEAGASQTVVLVQGNIRQSEKWQPASRLPIIETYRRLSEPHWGADLIVWPEAAITLFEHQAEELLALLDLRGKAHGTGLVLGIPAVRVYPNDEVAFLNIAVAVGTAEGRYVKRRLVPFGEYVPLEGLLRGLITFFDLPMSHAEPGAWRQPGLTLAGGRAGMAICYEIVYPDLVREPVGVLLTISNDTWFGDSLGPLQHLGIARMRALENGRWLLRATNNGITAIVDPAGRIVDALPQFEAGVLSGEFRIMSGRTPFNRFGHWPVLGLVVLILSGLALRSRLRSRG